jgi:selenocysteine lyase/cysteine desulfurase
MPSVETTSLSDRRDLFELSEEIAYFNTANMSPLLRRVHEAGLRALERRAEPWKIGAADWFDDVERLRQRFASIANVSSDGVALVPASSYGLGVAARNLAAEPGDQVIVLADEYPSNFHTWKRFTQRTEAELVVVEREKGQSWSEATVARIGDRTRVVAVPNVHWTNGALVDLPPIAAASREAGAALCVDASQSLGALPLDPEQLGADFVVAVGYKWLLGPLSVGYLYVAERHRDGEPLEENWINRAGSDDFAALVDYSAEYAPGARRFDVGERTNFGLVPMAIAGLEQLREWGVEEVADALRRMTGEIGRRVEALGLTVPPDDQRGPHMLGIELPREVARSIETSLMERKVVASVRGASLRISPHLNVTEPDIERLADGLAAAL